MKTIDIKGKLYVEVNERIKEFRNNVKYEGYTLESEIISLENGICTIKAVVKNPNGIIVATGLAQEKESSSFINKTSFVENCETSAWGRALGNLGIGIDTSIASADEVINAINNQTSESKPTKTQNKTKPAAKEKAETENSEKHYCKSCGKEITKRVSEYSANIYGEALCIECQKTAKKIA